MAGRNSRASAISSIPVRFNANILGCGGTFSGGMPAADALCGPGWSICSREVLVGYSLSKDQCRSTTIPGTGFFGANIASNINDAGFNCATVPTATNDVVGCAHRGDDNIVHDPASVTMTCAGLTAVITSDFVPTGWSIPDGSNEATVAALSDPTAGGALCCRDP